MFYFSRQFGRNRIKTLIGAPLKTSQKVLLLFILIGVLFIVGSIFNLNELTVISTYLLIPVLILYYRFKTKKWFLAMVIALLLFYIRDIFMLSGFIANPYPVMWTFATAIAILYLFAITNFQKAKVHPVEIISLVIMYGFLGFLYITIADLVPQVIPSYKGFVYGYLLLLTGLLALTFTQYLLKSHYASLWLMLAAASLLVSELSLFFKLYIISDLSVNVFFPLFHVIAYYAMVEHAINRRKMTSLPGF